MELIDGLKCFIFCLTHLSVFCVCVARGIDLKKVKTLLDWTVLARVLTRTNDVL